MKNREKQQKCINNQCCYVSERSKCKGHFPNVSEKRNSQSPNHFFRSSDNQVVK